MSPTKILFCLTTEEIDRCVVVMGRHNKTKTELAATSPVSKEDYYYASKISHHFFADYHKFIRLHLFIGGAQ